MFSYQINVAKPTGRKSMDGDTLYAHLFRTDWMSVSEVEARNVLSEMMDAFPEACVKMYKRSNVTEEVRL